MSKIKAQNILTTIPGEGLEQYALITLQIDAPVHVLLELWTHKRTSRCAASNRALSVKKNIQELGYYIPDKFYKRGVGMSAGEEIEQFSPLDIKCADIWKAVWDYCSNAAIMLEQLGIAKEQASRVLPTFKMMKTIVTANYDAWQKILELRDNPNADVAMQDLAKQIRKCVENPDPSKVKIDPIHQPFWDDERTPNSLYVSIARIARISYLSKGLQDEDIILAQRLLDNRHLSPLEQIARWDEYPYISAICSKEEDYAEPRFSHWGWTSARAYLEANETLDGFYQNF